MTMDKGYEFDLLGEGEFVNELVCPKKETKILTVMMLFCLLNDL